ncbi:MAG: ATP-dependent DNA helicase [Elusimicrobiota bacterium]
MIKKTSSSKIDITAEILKDLNPEQLKAVTHESGPLLIIAGAGTGKTRVITRRIAYLIATKKARPSEILALTFTDKAAAQMEERVDTLVPYGFNDVRISTFHAFGDRILRENALELGLPTDFRLLTPAEAAVFFRDNLFSFPLDYYRPLGAPTQYISSILKAFSRAKDEDVSPRDYVKFAEETGKTARKPDEKEEAERQIEVAKSYQKYEELKGKNGCLDFGDQVVMTLKLFREHPAILEGYRKRFKYILVDEFQDTNYAQFELVKLLASPSNNITVVGDDDQSIYKFRGACLSNILNFMEIYPSSETVVLRLNYRSTQSILDPAYKLITQNNPDRLEVRNKINKELKAEHKKGQEVRHLQFDTVSTEADETAKLISEKIKSGKYKAKDFAVLVRANDSAMPFIKSLNMLEIPWRFSGSQGLYERDEIRLLLAFLRVIANPEDSASLHYFASSQLYDFSPMELSVINHAASHYRRSLSHILRNMEKYAKETDGISQKTASEGKRLLADLEEYYALAQKLRTGELLYEFLKRSKMLENLYNAVSAPDVEKAKNIAKFFGIISRFGEITSYDRVTRFVEYLDALLEAGDDPAEADADFDVDAVNVMTIHKAKGLEFPVVFMVSLVEDRFPSRNRPDKIDMPVKLVKDILPEGDFHIQEERRLFYVGMTRAKDELYLTSALDYGGKRTKKVSRFVIEALDRPKADASAVKSSPREVIERFAPAPDPADKLLILPGKGGILTLSPYAIDDYLTCPLKYKYIHVLRVPLLRHHTVVFGEAVHNVLNEYFRLKQQGKKVTADDIVKMYEKYWSSAGFLSRDHEEERFRVGKDNLLKYYEEQEKGGIIPFSLEEEFKFMIGNKIRITGRWDRLDERTGSREQEAGNRKSGKELKTQNSSPVQRVIVDFKTTGKVRDQKKADDTIKDSRQLVIYAMGHESKYGRLPDLVELHFLESGLTASLKPAQEMADKLKVKIEEVAEGIYSRQFAANPEYMACQFCAYSNICRAKQT